MADCKEDLADCTKKTLKYREIVQKYNYDTDKICSEIANGLKCSEDKLNSCENATRDEAIAFNKKFCQTGDYYLITD